MKKTLKFKSKALPKLIDALDIQGYETRIVGGAVRDAILNIDSSDIDLATTLLPEQVAKLLAKKQFKYIDHAAQYGTILAHIDGENFEITTLRKDIECYGRRAKVEFTHDFALDAARRDFTINAMSYNYSTGELYDYCGGLEDLKNFHIRFIGSSDERIKEDYLRILRFFRFNAKYGTNLDQQALKECIKAKGNLGKLSRERVVFEFSNILKSPKSREIISIMHENSILQEIIPGVNWDVVAYSKAVEIAHKIGIQVRLSARYLCLLHNNPISLIKTELKKLTLPKKYIDKISCYHNYQELLKEYDLNYVLKLIIFKKKVDIGQFLIYISSIDILKLESLIDRYEEVAFLTPPEFPVNGNDLKSRGYQKELIGEKLRFLQEEWIKSDFTLFKNDLLKLI